MKAPFLRSGPFSELPPDHDPMPLSSSLATAPIFTRALRFNLFEALTLASGVWQCAWQDHWRRRGSRRKTNFFLDAVCQDHAPIGGGCGHNDGRDGFHCACIRRWREQPARCWRPVRRPRWWFGCARSCWCFARNMRRSLCGPTEDAYRRNQVALASRSRGLARFAVTTGMIR